MTATTTTPRDVRDDATRAAAPDPDDVRDDATRAAAPDPDDVREQIEVGVLFADGRLAGRRFASLAEAHAWASPEAGDQVVEFNPVCDCAV
jgi:hypothetical protein